MTKEQFLVLYTLFKNDVNGKEELSKLCDLSLESINKELKVLEDKMFIKDYSLTKRGIIELDKHKVDNAVIMAAGLSSRFAPLSYEYPKGLLEVKGERLIERQIKQLREAGIEEIIVVVGYMKEKFFYLEDKYNVKILINNDYYKRNNNSTLYVAQKYLKNNSSTFDDFEELRTSITKLYDFVESDGIQKRICHNDCYDPNFLTDGKTMYLIDWEYSGNSDPASDLGTFICCSDYTTDEAMEVLKIYFGRDLTDIEKRHYLAYVAISGYYWFVWALYKESVGEMVGEYLYIWYKYAKSYSEMALELYK